MDKTLQRTQVWSLNRQLKSHQLCSAAWSQLLVTASWYISRSLFNEFMCVLTMEIFCFVYIHLCPKYHHSIFTFPHTWFSLYSMSYRTFHVSTCVSALFFIHLYNIPWNGCVFSHSVMSNFLQPHRLFQTTVLEWVAIPYSRGYSWPKDWTLVSCVSCIDRWILCHCVTWEAQGMDDEILFNNKIFSLVDSWYLFLVCGYTKTILYFGVILCLMYLSLSIWVRHPWGKFWEVQLLIEGYIYPKF